MKKPGIFLCPAVACLTLVLHAQAQTETQTPAPIGDVVRYSGEYMRTVGDNAVLFNGKVQERMPGGIESMYLRDRGYVERNEFGDEIFPLSVDPLASYSVGDILYDGVFYTGVRMRLDLYRDELVAAATGDFFFGALLDPSRLGYADLRGYRIIHLPAPTAKRDIPGGYYLMLHQGRHNVLKKEHFEFNSSRFEFTTYSIRYYVARDGVYHRIGRRKGPLLRLFREHRGELARFIRSRGFSMQYDTERALVEIVKEYERLTDR